VTKNEEYMLDPISVVLANNNLTLENYDFTFSHETNKFTCYINGTETETKSGKVRVYLELSYKQVQM